ncbi:MAG: hypothetical protein ACPKQO_07960 [Nitrososphaeraceae archaeon]
MKLGKVFLAFDVIDNCNSELDAMNKDKKGTKFSNLDHFSN